MLGVIHGLYAARVTSERTFIVKRYSYAHNCYRSLTNRQANANWSARDFLEKFMRNPDLSVDHMLN